MKNNRLRWITFGIAGLFALCSVLLFAVNTSTTQKTNPEKINLALRRTAHLLMSEAGDKKSNIPLVEHPTSNIWLVRMEHSVHYDSLPKFLQASFQVHNIDENYDVSLLRCFDGEIFLGYNNVDLLENGVQPCQGRDQKEDCYTLQVTFPAIPAPNNYLPTLIGAFLLLSIVTWILYRWAKKPLPSTPHSDAPEENLEAEGMWQSLSISKINTNNQVLVVGAHSNKITYREGKLLQLFFSHPNALLERKYILQHVWEDEGILVGRSLDVFVSRLRKLLQDDPGLRIVAVHGVGYKLEVG